MGHEIAIGIETPGTMMFICVLLNHGKKELQESLCHEKKQQAVLQVFKSCKDDWETNQLFCFKLQSIFFSLSKGGESL